MAQALVTKKFCLKEVSFYFILFCYYLYLEQNQSVSSKASHKSKVSKSSSDKHSGSSQLKSGSSHKSVPLKPVNVSFIKKEKKKLKSYLILFHDFKCENSLQTYYLLFDYLRFVGYVFIISFCHKYGKSLSIVILVLNFLYLCYTIAIVPFRRIYVLIETIILEAIADGFLLLMVLY